MKRDKVAKRRRRKMEKNKVNIDGDSFSME